MASPGCCASWIPFPREDVLRCRRCWIWAVCALPNLQKRATTLFHHPSVACAPRHPRAKRAGCPEKTARGPTQPPEKTARGLVFKRRPWLTRLPQGGKRGRRRARRKDRRQTCSKWSQMTWSGVWRRLRALSWSHFAASREMQKQQCAPEHFLARFFLIYELHTFSPGSTLLGPTRTSAGSHSKSGPLA
jgi:hypothetical protein